MQWDGRDVSSGFVLWRRLLDQQLWTQVQLRDWHVHGWMLDPGMRERLDVHHRYVH